MTYATQQDLIDRFGEEALLQLADRDQDGVIDAAVVDSALADADDLINSYLARRYGLPLSAVPAMLTRRAADIARYYLYGDLPTEVVETAYKEAVKWLKDIGDGKAVLDAAGIEPDSAGGGAQHGAPGRVFTGDSLKDFTG